MLCGVVIISINESKCILCLYRFVNGDMTRELENCKNKKNKEISRSTTVYRPGVCSLMLGNIILDSVSSCPPKFELNPSNRGHFLKFNMVFRNKEILVTYRFWCYLTRASIRDSAV